MKRFSRSSTAWVVVFLLIAFVGFADAVYLTASHYMGGLPTCTIVEGCDEVAMSAYSTFGPIPIALLGVLFYTAMLIWGMLWLDTRKFQVFRFLPYVTVPAFVFSMWLIYVMYFVIEAICIYCLISSATTTLIMLLSFRFRRKF